MAGAEDNEVLMEDVKEKVALMEQFAVGILEAFNQQTESNKETQETVGVLSKKIQEMALHNEELQVLLERAVEEGDGSGGGAMFASGGSSVDEDQVVDIIETYINEKLDFTRLLKGHTTRIFQEVEKRYLKQYPPEAAKKKKNTPKVIAASVAVTLLTILAGWGVFVNVKEKPYYELIIPAGGHVLWKEPNENEPRQVKLQGEMIVPLAYYKQGKFLFYTYDASGLPVKNSSGEPVVYYIYDKMVADNKAKAIKLGVAE